MERSDGNRDFVFGGILLFRVVFRICRLYLRGTFMGVFFCAVCKKRNSYFCGRRKHTGFYDGSYVSAYHFLGRGFWHERSRSSQNDGRIGVCAACDAA